MKKHWIILKRKIEFIELLLILAELGAIDRWVETSTTRLAKLINASQQTVSRKLHELAKEGFIERNIVPSGEEIKITSKGINLLLEYHERLGSVLKKVEHGKILMRGLVVKGVGEGRYYMSLKGYIAQIKKKLGFKPYPGTLNLKLKTTDDILKKFELQKLPGILIKGFTNGIRTYGDVKVFKAEINGLKPLAIVLPERTSHNIEIIEIIAPFNLRDKLHLKDGDEVAVIVYLQ